MKSVRIAKEWMQVSNEDRRERKKEAGKECAQEVRMYRLKEEWKGVKEKKRGGKQYERERYKMRRDKLKEGGRNKEGE
jgi:hypothetical protein